MKKLTDIAILSAFALALTTSSFAAPKKEAAATAAAETKKAAEKTDAPKADATKTAKPLPLYSRVDAIDPEAKSFTHKNADGKEVKFTTTAETEIKNGDAAAKFGDIKVGDFVSGLRQKKSDTEWEVVKITKFGPAKAKTKEPEDAPKKETKKAGKEE